VTVIRDDDGKIIGYRGIMRDVTKQKQLEQQFLQAQKMESIGALAGGIAHDFNNILGGILGYASLVKMQMSQNDPNYRHIDTIEKSGLRAANLTAQLLGFARGGKYHPTAVQINDIVTETREIIASTFDKSIEVASFMDDTLPMIEVDATQMQQVLMNLLVNAGDAMPSGGKITIETSFETLDEQYADRYSYVEPGAYVVLSVADTGMGMDKETLEKVFEPFFTTKEEGKGTGLGLSMVYGVVKNHDGFLHVYSEPGEGTLFKVYLPAVEAPAKAEALSDEEDNDLPQMGDELILVVDDEEPIRRLAREILEGHGYKVLLAEDGLVGLETFKRENGNIDLVILDMAMPNLGGRETFLKMKALKPDVKAVLSTGFSENAKARQIMRDGVTGFIQKPYRVNALLSKVREALDAA
jgi:nitrogen-specific signal transduction histidine kinase/CheY-like chemotaxis protein